ncbi:MAG: hypothetical protein AAFV80_00575 [Bacteroidota bacterium]
MNTNFTLNPSYSDPLGLQWKHIQRPVQIKIFGQKIAETRSAFFLDYHRDGLVKRFVSVPFKQVQRHYFMATEELTEHSELGEVISLDYLRNRTWKANYAFLYPHGGPFRTTAQLVFPIEHIAIE